MGTAIAHLPAGGVSGRGEALAPPVLSRIVPPLASSDASFGASFGASFRTSSPSSRLPARSQALPPKGPRRVAVYVHFPWCLAKCPYCDFVSYASPREDIDHEGYADAVISELESRIRALGAAEVGSIFFGGGTPSLWSPTALGRVLGAVLSKLNVATELEVTVECNPTSLDRSVADALAEQGVNRLSIGAQALRSEQLRFLGRLHDVAGALSAIEAALASRVPRVSADLIFGLPGQSPDDAS